ERALASLLPARAPLVPALRPSGREGGCGPWPVALLRTRGPPLRGGAPFEDGDGVVPGDDSAHRLVEARARHLARRPSPHPPLSRGRRARALYRAHREAPRRCRGTGLGVLLYRPLPDRWSRALVLRSQARVARATHVRLPPVADRRRGVVAVPLPP